MAWRDAQGVRWNARRSNGWPNDSKAPDGYTVAGFRKIDQKGRIRFGGSYWTHDRLSENKGRVVRVCWGGPLSDYTIEVAQVFFGDAAANPENYLDHHSSFYFGDSVLCDSPGDWNPRRVML